MVVPVRLIGKTSEGAPFSDLAHTLDISRTGARLGGIREPLRVGDTLTVEYKRRRAQFRVQWLGRPGSRNEQQVGVELLEAENILWLELPEQSYIDKFDPSRRCVHAADLLAPAAAESTGESAAGISGNGIHGKLGAEVATPTNRGATGGVVEESLSSVDRASGAESEGRHAEFEPTLLALDLSSHSRIISALEASINARALSLDSALDLLAGNAQQLFDASGAAIALPDGGEMVCRASAGRAPEIGVSFRAENGLSGEAVRSGRVVICHDTFRDPRVNSEVWRSVGIRSAISVPIALSKGILGILEVFAAESNAFTSAHGTLLEQLSLLVARIIENPHDRSGDRLLHDVKAK